MTRIKNEQLEKLRTPNYMWILFETAQGVQSCLEKRDFKFGSYEFVLKRAQPPSDIKYENVKIEKSQHKRRKRCAKAFVVLFGACFFFIG
mmetsp:Transcript_31432/g.39028  ORF Transcript_31432/g.39028 Transcript_31432/m.39028 type:complete len:90 (+) Transcript_31432:1485-1754(+)